MFPVAKAITTHHEAVVAEIDLSNAHNEQPRFIDIGYVAGVHGYQGDVRVKTNTDFPQLRFSTVRFMFFEFLCMCFGLRFS